MTTHSHGSDANADTDLARAVGIAESVPDPEIPILTLGDLGVIRGARRDGRHVLVAVTPTYTGCPATLAIRLAVEAALAAAGMGEARVETVLAPAWTTDDLSEAGQAKLRAVGIAPPAGKVGHRALFGEDEVTCPRCGSADTERLSEFGATPCKALWRCAACREPFDYFKCI
jgi:ring-1,2-phenylacetyl-CoA epoxidase subunit PaaD